MMAILSLIGSGAVKAILGALGFLAGALTAYLAGRRSQARSTKIAGQSAEIDTLKTVQEAHHAAETQDDIALAARLSRKP